jgi:glyoxylase-like metal-dependent hydrolase (beta-lactamase superfamily II)
MLPIVLLLSACSFRDFVIDKTVREQVHFLPDVEHFHGSELTKLTDRVYTFRWTWDRNLVVLTDEGFVVADPFNAEAATALKAELNRVAPGRPVRAMIYSHYHLDHVVGGAVLQAQEVLAHKKCPQYWTDLSDYPVTKEIAPPTRLIEGDQKLVIGGVEIDLIALDRSHTDTLYAYYLPKEKILHTADVGLVRTIYPIGGPDMYMPGMIREMEKLAKLDFDTWIPSHFTAGKKSDFLEALEFATTTHNLARDAWVKYGLPADEDAFSRSFHAIYDPIKQKYSHYRGFKEQGLFHVTRAFSGAVLGY